MYRHFIEAEIARVRDCSHAGMLSDVVVERLEATLTHTAMFVAGDTQTHLVAEAIAEKNPIAASFPDLITNAERERAKDVIRRRIDNGMLRLPGPLVGRLCGQLHHVTDAFLEALGRIVGHRDEIADALLKGRRFSEVVDVELLAGDIHNRARSVTIFHTDTGSFVYKPHDMRVDVEVHDLCERLFGDFVGTPVAIAFGGDFGVCEFVEKRRAEGDREARRFWYALGGLMAFAKIMGSTDLHNHNIICCGGLPYLIDLETAMGPVLHEDFERARDSLVARAPDALTDAFPHHAGTDWRDRSQRADGHQRGWDSACRGRQGRRCPTVSGRGQSGLSRRLRARHEEKK